MIPLNHGEATSTYLLFHTYLPFAADEEHQQNVAAAAAAAVARPRPHTDERGDGMPRRRRNMGNRMMAQRRAQQAEDWLEGNIWFCSPNKY